jgi:hypothetical protein
MPEGEAIGGPEGFDEARTQDGATEVLLLLEPTTRATSHFEEKRSRRKLDQTALIHEGVVDHGTKDVQLRARGMARG